MQHSEPVSPNLTPGATKWCAGIAAIHSTSVDIINLSLSTQAQFWTSHSTSPRLLLLQEIRLGMSKCLIQQLEETGWPRQVATAVDAKPQSLCRS